MEQIGGKIDGELNAALNIGKSLARTITTGTGDFILIFRDWEFDIAHIKTLSHEVHHLLDYVLQEMGEERREGEWEAYFVGHVTELILNELNHV